ncbi:hypothetical protein MVEN_00538200 [Mycena venus]|uniref:Uncharacterized protein n=1 Tax=Mycena venus TaxID=2733690 RepID=A0A8H7D774_9AGAR|nr:hypothetical protein MVEN_00538200 [Mycena venus]
MPPSLQHQRSTKLLINRFESLSGHEPSSRLAVIPPATKTPLHPPKQLVESKKDKSPLRQSFRNLFAVLKKNSGLRVGKPKFEDTKPNQMPLPNKTLPAEDPFVASTKIFPIPQLAGSLFYLARSPETSTSQVVLPVWTFCSAVLEGDTVHLTWPITSTHSVFLKHCTDVRSRTLDELDSEERALIPADAKDIKVFEVLERARWVSAIWEVILPSNSSGGPPEGNKISGIADSDTGPSRPSTIYLDRALPPVPEPPTPIAAPSPLIPVSPIPTRPESCASSIYQPSKNPSIANLGRLSVVTQRRAQIEGTQYPRSTPASPSRLYRNSSVDGAGAGRASPTSILDSYGATCSPVDRQLSPPVDTIPDEPEEQHHSSIQDGYPSCQPQNISPHVDAPSTDAHDSLLTDIHNMMSSVARRIEATENNLNYIIQNQLCQPARPDLDSTVVTNRLRDINERLCSDLPYIMKLLAQIQACQSDTESKEIASKSLETRPSCDPEKLNQILNLLKEDSLQRSVQTQQQTDSWLEAFVSGGTAQIQVVAAGVDKLCQQLGCSGERGTSILAEIRQLLIASQAKDQTAALQASINNLAALMNSDSRSFTAQSIAGLIDQQRQDQEGLLRALAAELSSEIRGERLGFVDAIKEATTINVQMQVEQLKKELAREVGADLFAYYSQQKQPGVPPTRPSYVSHSTMGPPPRTLPNPRYGGYP